MLIHPQYHSGTFQNDICILKTDDLNLRLRYEFSEYENHFFIIWYNVFDFFRHTAAPACLPRSNWHPDVGTRCYAAGWGRMSSNKPAVVLQEVQSHYFTYLLSKIFINLIIHTQRSILILFLIKDVWTHQMLAHSSRGKCFAPDI